jgi:hypothetical protein
VSEDDFAAAQRAAVAKAAWVIDGNGLQTLHIRAAADTRDHLPRVVASIREHAPDAKLIHLTSRRQVHRFTAATARTVTISPPDSG